MSDMIDTGGDIVDPETWFFHWNQQCAEVECSCGEAVSIYPDDTSRCMRCGKTYWLETSLRTTEKGKHD